MTSMGIARNKYSNAAHIGRILPLKRLAGSAIAITTTNFANQALID
jgi:hypothetical protein